MMKKAQIQLTFHWIYILIAGAVILSFFIGLIMQQKVSAEESLSREVVDILGSILVGAGVSEKTKNFVDISGLSSYTLEFKCEQDYAGFGIKGGRFQELPLEPVFAPQEIQGTKLLIWSLPYYLPYKVMDLLMVSSNKIKYTIIGKGAGDFYSELVNSTKGFNIDFVENLDNLSLKGNFHLRIVDFSGQVKDSFPSSLISVEDKKISLVDLSDTHKVSYYIKKESSWEKGKEVQIVSLGGEKDVARYGALFAEDGDSYQCNMMKVFQRMYYVNKVYQEKLKEMIKHYNNNNQTSSANCLMILNTQTNSVKKNLDLLDKSISSCRLDYSFCSSLVSIAQQLKKLNTEDPNYQDLESQDCVMVY